MRKWLLGMALVVSTALAAGLCSTANAQAKYPNRAVRAIVPFSPGTTADLIARNIGPQLSEAWKVPVFVDNRAGASGIIGIQAAIAAPPDGHTLLFVADNFASAAAVHNKPYDPVNDLDPVILLARGDYALIAPASSPAKTVEELIALARANPGKINYATPGSGAPAHLMMELFKSTLGIDLVHVPYKSNAEAITGIVGGQVSAMFTSMGVALPLAAGGRVRILAAGASARAPRTPDVQSFSEAGVRGFNVSTWFGLFVPRNTPQELKTRLNADVGAVLRLPGVGELMSKQGIAAAGSTPAELHELVRGDFERWNRVVRDAKITAD
jgi:tripartite-type tricarboxylate transporter receptor subunit TctC